MRLLFMSTFKSPVFFHAQCQKEPQLQLSLQQLLLLPGEIQDKIIGEISALPHCDQAAIDKIIHFYLQQEYL